VRAAGSGAARGVGLEGVTFPMWEGTETDEVGRGNYELRENWGLL
jgi:hypothetical protein